MENYYYLKSTLIIVFPVDSGEFPEPVKHMLFIFMCYLPAYTYMNTYPYNVAFLKIYIKNIKYYIILYYYFCLQKRGDIMLGMCYLPTAERMSVTIVKLNNLNPFFTDGMISKQSKADFLVCTLQFAVFISDLYVKNGLQFITRDLSCKWFR